jgi:hypothetical protein
MIVRDVLATKGRWVGSIQTGSRNPPPYVVLLRNKFHP